MREIKDIIHEVFFKMGSQEVGGACSVEVSSEYHLFIEKEKDLNFMGFEDAIYYTVGLIHTASSDTLETACTSGTSMQEFEKKLMYLINNNLQRGEA